MGKLTKAQKRSQDLAKMAELEQEIVLLCEMVPVYPGDPTGALMGRVRAAEAERAALARAQETRS
jgi:hypothetical protein